MVNSLRVRQQSRGYIESIPQHVSIQKSLCRGEFSRFSNIRVNLRKPGRLVQLYKELTSDLNEANDR